jgi:hypothetical protein
MNPQAHSVLVGGELLIYVGVASPECRGFAEGVSRLRSVHGFKGNTAGSLMLMAGYRCCVFNRGRRDCHFLLNGWLGVLGLRGNFYCLVLLNLRRPLAIV